MRTTRSRREHLAALLGLAAWPVTFAIRAQRAPGPRRVGVIFWRVPQAELEGQNPRLPQAGVLRESLVSHGWVPGKNLELIWRSAEGSLDRLDIILDELIGIPVDVLALSGNTAVKSAMRKTRAIPIVMTLSTSPVEAGLIASFARPGGNVTGVSAEQAEDLNGKRLALLKQIAPQVTHVAFLQDARINSFTGGITPATEAAARELGLTLLPYEVESLADLERAMREALRMGANAVFVDTSLSAVEANQPAFHRLAARHKLPAMHTYPNNVMTGGLMHYGIAWGLSSRRAAFYIDRILRGSKPADMPVEQPSSYELSINLKAAREIALVVPESIRAQASRIIE